VSKVLSLQLEEGQLERLERLARRLGRTPSETSALLIEESLRRSEFAYIEFRDSSAGRQAYITGSSLAVWEVIMIARGYGGDATRTAEHLRWPISKVQAALLYAAAYPREIADALSDSQPDFETLSRMLPGLERFPAETK